MFIEIRPSRRRRLVKNKFSLDNQITIHSHNMTVEIEKKREMERERGTLATKSKRSRIELKIIV